MGADTHYEVLGVEADATQGDIKAAYRRLSRQVHPDQGGSGALFRKVAEAYETLSDPSRRAEYDESLRSPRGGPEPEEPSEESSEWHGPDDDGEPPPGWSPDPGDHGSYPSGRAGAQSRTGRLLAAHPAGSLVGMGVLLILVAGSFGPGRGASLGLLGLLAILVGVVALVGSRRVIPSGRALGSTLTHIDAMTGPQFESFLAMLFTKSGCRVHKTGGKGDLGADLVIEQAGWRMVVQAKRSAAPVGHAAVQQAVGAIAPYGATGAMVVTNATFTAHAARLAQANRVVLWDRQVLIAEMRRLALFTTGNHGERVGLSGWALLGAELRAGFPMAARAIAVVLGVLIAAWAASGTRSRSRSPRRRRW